MIPQRVGYDYMAYLDYMDLAVRYPRMAVKLTHSLRLLLWTNPRWVFIYILLDRVNINDLDFSSGYE